MPGVGETMPERLPSTVCSKPTCDQSDYYSPLDYDHSKNSKASGTRVNASTASCVSWPSHFSEYIRSSLLVPTYPADASRMSDINDRKTQSSSSNNDSPPGSVVFNHSGKAQAPGLTVRSTVGTVIPSFRTMNTMRSDLVARQSSLTAQRRETLAQS